MTKKIMTFGPNDSAVDICKLFLASSVRRVPIIDNNKLVGIVSRRDVLALILNTQR